MPIAGHAKHLRNDLNVVVTQTKGFHVEDSKIGRKCIKPPCQYDKYTNWTGENVGANMTLSFTIPDNSSSQWQIKSQSKSARCIAVSFWTCPVCGAAHMWVDQNYKEKKFVNMKFGHMRATMAILAFHVKPGPHFINIEIIQKGHVSIFAIMIGPPDGPY